MTANTVRQTRITKAGLRPKTRTQHSLTGGRYKHKSAYIKLNFFFHCLIRKSCNQSVAFRLVNTTLGVENVWLVP